MERAREPTLTLTLNPSPNPSPNLSPSPNPTLRPNPNPHQVYNDGVADRFVLMCEVWHPALTPAEREALVTLFALKDRFTLLELKQRPWGARLG